MARVLNKNNFKNLLLSLGLPYDNKTRNVISSVFTTALNVVKSEIIDKKTHKNNNNKNKENFLLNKKKIAPTKESLIDDIEKMSNSDKEILSLVLHKINIDESFNVSPLEWLTSESLSNLLKFSYDSVFPISGENLFYRWCYVHKNRLEDEIENLKLHIKSISLPAKILIHNEVIKWRVHEFKENSFDLFLSFLSFLQEEEVNTLVLNQHRAI